MLDRALGIEPVPRRKRPDATSEASSNKESSNPSLSSPTRPAIKKLYNEEPTQNQEKEQENPITTSFNKPKPKATSRQESRGNESEQEISSPAVKNLNVAKVPKNRESMKSSTKIYLQESAKHMEASTHIAENKSSDDLSYKIKIVVFLIISVLLTLNAMTPDRKVSYRRK